LQLRGGGGRGLNINARKGETGRSGPLPFSHDGDEGGDSDRLMVTRVAATRVMVSMRVVKVVVTAVIMME
jgi:hypothetical protein